MEIDLKAVLDVFDSVINGEMALEEAHKWAFNLMRKNEHNELICIPPSDRERIWEGIMYLCGLDMQDAPDVYLYTIEDVKDFKEKLL